MKKLENLSNLLNRVENIIKQIKNNERICIVHHDDTDGCCSAAMFSILINNLIGDYPMLFPVTGLENVNSRLFYRLKDSRPDHIFVFDITVEPKTLNNYSGFVLDHHIFDDIESTQDMPYLNPRYFEKKDENVVPTSYLVYRILKQILPSEKIAWIAAIGVTEDHRVDICKDVFEEVKKDNPELLKIEEINQENVEKSFFGELWDMVRSGRMIRGNEGAKTAVMALIECKDRPDKLVNGLTQHSLALRKFYEKLVYETQNCLRNVERNGRFYRDKKVIVYEQERMKIRGLTSFISDKLRQKYPDWISYVINKSYGDSRAKISIRLEQKFRSENLVSIINDAKSKIPHLKGGGHKSAVGVILNLDDAPDFEREFLGHIKPH